MSLPVEFSDIAPQYWALEGGGGCGKDTAVGVLAPEITHLTGRIVVTTREPGGTPQAEIIREQIFKAKGKKAWTGLQIVDGFNRARVLLVEDFIKPNLCAGRHVLTDRYAASTWAYEGGGEGVPFDLIEETHLKRVGLFGPDATFYLRLSAPKIGLRRKPKHMDNDAFDLETVEYQRRVHAVYDRLYEENHNPDNINPIFGLWYLIDADCPPDQVAVQLQQKVRQHLELQESRKIFL